MSNIQAVALEVVDVYVGKNAQLGKDVYAELQEIAAPHYIILKGLVATLSDKAVDPVIEGFLMTAMSVQRYFYKGEGGEKITLDGLDFRNADINNIEDLMKRQSAVPIKAWSKIVNAANELNTETVEELVK